MHVTLPSRFGQRGAWGWSLAKTDVKITTKIAIFQKISVSTCLLA